MASRPSQVLTKAAGMGNGAANATNGGMSGDGDRFHGRGFLQITGRKTTRAMKSTVGKISQLIPIRHFSPQMITMLAMHLVSFG